MDWKQLIQAVGPVAIGMATKGQHGAVLRGYMAEQDRIANEERQQQQEVQRRRQVGASMSMELMGRLQQETDPVRFEQLRSTITKHADAYGIDPNEFASMPLPDGSADKLKELSQILDGLSRSGYNPDDLAESGASVKLKNGQTVPVSDALRLTQTRPVDASGAMVPAPKRADVSASTDYGRFLSRYAKAQGKKVDDLTADEELAARKQFNTIDDRATPAPKLTPAEAQLADLIDIWKMSHPGQEPPASVRAQLRRQATREIGTADDRPPASGGGGVNPYQEFTIAEKLAKSWTDATKSAREMDRQYSLMQTGLTRFRKGDKNGGSQAVLVTFQKILDPTSVVRESEYARSAEGIALMNRMQGAVEKLQSGGAGVTDADLAAMVETARQFVENMKTYTRGQRSRIDAQVKKYKLDPATVFDDVLTGAPETSAASFDASTIRPVSSRSGRPAPSSDPLGIRD